MRQSLRIAEKAAEAVDERGRERVRRKRGRSRFSLARARLGQKQHSSAGTAGPGPAAENAEVARIFREVADLLEVQSANPFRVRAYPNAARVVEEREGRGEIDAAREDRLPELIELGDVRGDLQCHTTDSDGHDSLEAMAEAAEALGYEYLAVTDHSPALRMVRGLDAAGFTKQMRRIERLNARLRKLTVLKGAEVDIHPDGSLDLPDAVLEALDVLVAAVHSKFDLPAEQQTRRVLQALRRPSVDILAHPTGRLIGRRKPMSLDLSQIVRAACDHGVLLELNAQPERLDLDDIAGRSALTVGARLVINTDAHAAHELRFMRWGVDQARRAWAEKRDVANTLGLAELMKLLHGSEAGVQRGARVWE